VFSIAIIIYPINLVFTIAKINKLLSVVFPRITAYFNCQWER